MDERADRGEFYPGGRTTPEGGGGTDTDKVDRVNLGEVGESYTLKEVKNKVNQIVRAIAPAASCLAMCAWAATAPLEDLPNTAPVVTNEEDAVAMAAVGALEAATSNQVAELSSAFRTGLADGTNAVLRAAMGAVAAESNRVDATFAKRSEIPAAPDLAPYALKSELPQDYLTENDITNFATRAWIEAQGYGTGAEMGARLDAQDLAIVAASQRVEIVDNAWRAADAAASNRVTGVENTARNNLAAATNALWIAHKADANALRAADAAASNRVTGVENTARNNLAAATNRVWQGVRAASNALARADAALQREIDALEIVAVDGKAATRLVTPVGSLWQDATGVVWQVVTARACTNATEEWTYLVDGQTYTRAQMIERAGGDEDYSQILVWMDSNFEGAGGTTRHFEGWFVRDGSSTAPVGYSFATDEIPAYAADMLLAQVDYYGGITAMRGEEVLRTNAVDRVAYTNDLAAATNGVMGEVDNRFNQWGEMGTVLGARTLVGTNDTVTADAVIEAIGSGGGGGGGGASLAAVSNVVNGAIGMFAATGTVYLAERASEASSAEEAYLLFFDGDARSYADIIADATTVATNTVDAKISTNNAAFVSAVLAAPLVGASPSDLSELAEYGTYGTVGAAILALIAGLAALKRRMTAAETTISGKQDMYEMVTVSPSSGTLTVDPYTVSKYTAGSSAAAFTVAVGTGTAGKARDCILVIDGTATGAVAPTVTWPSNFHPRTDAGTDFACEATRNIYYISEYAAGEFTVGGWQETAGGNGT